MKDSGPVDPPGGEGPLAHDPIRMCVGCRTRYSQRKLTRIARRSDGQLFVSWSASTDGSTIPCGAVRTGRSAYLCLGAECLKRASKGGPLAHAFRGTKVTVGPELLAMLGALASANAGAGTTLAASEGSKRAFPDARGGQNASTAESD